MMWMMMLAAAAAGPADLKTFTDWTVGCDNGRACHATSLMPESGDWDVTIGLSIMRAPEANAQPEISLIGEGGKTYRLRTVKGAPIRLVVKPGRSDPLVDPRDAPALIAATKTDAEIVVQDGAGKQLGTVSLAGARAAMLFMDEAQQRIGTITALARPGTKPASAVPSPPALPEIRSAARKAVSPFKIPPPQIAALRKAHDCVAPEGIDAGYDASEDALDGAHVLLLLGCGAGAYNFSSIAFVAERKAGKIAVAPLAYDFPPTAGEGTPMLVNAEWVPNDGVISSFSKGRGIGDCGTFADYAWDGRRLRLAEMSEMRECRGSMDYITTWRAKVVN
jgi:hypothetical protein